MSASEAPARSPRRGAGAPPRPRTASARRTARTRPRGRRRTAADRAAGPPRGHSGNTGTRPRGSGTAPRPPAPRPTRCGIWGRSYRSRHRWLVRAPACAPQFWTTWRCWCARRAGRPTISSRQRWSRPSMMALPTAWSGRCSPGGATTVRQAPAAFASARVTWATVPSLACASSSVPATVNANSLRVRRRIPSPGRDPAVEAVAAVVDRGSGQREPLPGERAVDDRRHPPAGDRVLPELEQALAHPLPRSRQAAAAATSRSSACALDRRHPPPAADGRRVPRRAAAPGRVRASRPRGRRWPSWTSSRRPSSGRSTPR